MTRWEYRVTTSVEELARLGREGWGIVSMVVEPGSGTHTYYLARAAQSFRDRVTLEQKQRYYASLGKTVMESDAP